MYIDTLTRIKNAQMKGEESVKVPYSKMDKAVLDVLKKEGFLKSIDVKGKKPKKVVKVIFNENKPIRGLSFLSKPSLRKYLGYRDMMSVKGGYGVLVVSTPKGVMSGDKARKEKVGGQLLFKMW